MISRQSLNLSFVRWAGRLPWSVVVLAFALVGLSWIGVARCEQIGSGSGRLLTRQIVWSLVGLAAMFVLTLPNYRVLARHSYAIFLLAIGLLIGVYFFPSINGVHRWMRLGPIGLQPSEVAKVAFVLAVARYLMYRENHRTLGGLLAPLALTLVPVLLILREPDLGTSAVFIPVLFLMLFAAGARHRDLLVVTIAGLLVLPILWTQMSGAQRARVQALFQQTQPEERPARDSYHLHQAKGMIAEGGVWGRFWNEHAAETDLSYRVPEAATDSIVVVLAERFGQVGFGLVLLVYFLLAWRGIVIAESTREPFGRLVATGVVALFAVQVVINTGMMVGLLPITGLSLPMISYGGSGVVSHAMALGLVLNVGMRPGYDVGQEPFRYART